MNPIISMLRFFRRGLQFMVTGVPNNIINVNVVSLAPSKLLEARCALITGGTSGIGYEIAKAYIKAGAKVCITGRSQKRIKDACEKLSHETNTEDRIFGFELNNLEVNKFGDAIEKISKIMGGLDILVNNAGVQGAEFPNAIEEDYDSAMDVNLKAVFFLSQEIGKYMISNSIKGNILNIASSSSLRPAITAYTISKWGLRGLTLGLARALVHHGITVNGLAPGATATPMLNKNDNNNLYYPYSLIGRYATPEEIANMAVILVSDMGRTIVGDIVYMTGGMGLLSFEDMKYDVFKKD